MALAAAGLLAACSDAALSADEARRLTIDAFAAAGLDAEETSTPERTEVDVPGDERVSVWLLTVDVDGEEWTVGVDPERGSIVRTFEPVGSTLTDEQVDTLARFRDDPDDGGSSALVLAGVGIGLAGGYLVLRRLAARARARPVRADPDD